ncbi:MAG: hypothetical protein ACOC78_00305 [Actinomycetota bacterium]
MEISTLPMLSEAELRAGLRVFSEARDQHVEQDHHALAGVYAALAAAFKGEKVRRERMFRHHERECSSVEEWGWQPDN